MVYVLSCKINLVTLVGYLLCNAYMLMVYTGCKDIDDALHCTMLPSGNFEVGVRIL